MEAVSLQSLNIHPVGRSIANAFSFGGASFLGFTITAVKESKTRKLIVKIIQLRRQDNRVAVKPCSLGRIHPTHNFTTTRLPIGIGYCN